MEIIMVYEDEIFTTVVEEIILVESFKIFMRDGQVVLASDKKEK